MPERSPRPLTQVDRAYEALKKRICDGVWAGGDVRLEREAAAEIGVSRTPIREALIRLEDERLVRIRPRRGFVVLPISASDMSDIYEILTALESAAAAKLAEMVEKEQAMARLNAAVRAMEDALAEDDLAKWAEADSEFHRALVEEAGNARLAAVAATVSVQAHRARIATLHLRPKPIKSNNDHIAVVEAIRIGDVQTAFERHKAHRENARELIVSLLIENGYSAI
ncbi:MAG TPA: GntR family transcriptional regulator [Afifellaceae bacterium]|nr:GntR family transcriptional regulator [Afifellaceae bacterium]